MIFWYAVRLKTVFLDDNTLRVCGFITELEIPFSDIASIKHNWFWKNATLKLTHLRRLAPGFCLSRDDVLPPRVETGLHLTCYAS